MQLAKFEADSGRSVQIVARDSERMSSAARAFERQLQRQADQAGRTQAEFLALRAAEIGASEAAEKLINQIARGTTVTAAVSAQSVAGIGAVTSAAETSTARQKALNLELVQSIRAVNAATEQRRAELIAQEKAGKISPDQLKTGLSGLSTTRSDSIERLKAEAEAQRIAILQTESRARAESQAADAAAAAAQKERAAAQVVIDAQNGVTASYRQRLAALRDLRDKGLLSKEQFQTAGAELVNQQPAVQRRQQEADAARAAATLQAKVAREAADAEVAATERRRAALGVLNDTLGGLTQTYRRNLTVLQESLKAGDISPKQFQTQLASLNDQQNPNVLRYRQEAAAAQKAADEIAAAAARKASAETASTQAFVDALQRQADAIGKTRVQLLAEEAARRGVTAQAQPFIDKLGVAEKNLNKFGRTAGITAYELQTLSYTASDVVASLASGISPLTILLQQGGQVRDVFGGFGNALRGIASLFTVTRVAIGGTAAVVGTLAYAMYQGAKQSKEYADAVVLSGNFAGKTEGQFNALTRTIAASGQVQVSAAREFGQALISTGQISGKNLDAATEAAARFGAATGKSAKDVAAQFAELGSDVSAGASKLNQTYNFLTAAQLQQIRTLQDQGKSADATAIVYDALNNRLRALEPNLGTLDRALRAVSTTWDDFWDRAYAIGRNETIEDKISRTRREIESLNKLTTRRANLPAFSTAPALREDTTADDGRAAALRDRKTEDLRLLNRSQAAAEAVASNAAELAKLNKDAAGADEFVRGMERRSKSAEGLARELAAANAEFAKQDALAAKDANYKPSSADTRAKILAKIREDFTDRPADTETNQVAKAERDKALKALQDSLTAERNAVAFQNEYMRALYDQGEVSLETFYAKRREATERDTQEQLNTIDGQISVQKRYLEFIKNRDPSEAVSTQKNIDSLNEKAAEIVQERQRKIVLANEEEKASYRALSNQVLELRASILQLQGDEESAAKLRAQNAIENARLFAGQAGGNRVSDADLAAREKAEAAAIRFAELQRRVGVVSADASRAEEAASLKALQSGASLYESEQGIYAIRAASLAQLGDLAAKASELAQNSTNPAVLAFARDLELQYAKSADAVDPFLNRLRENGRGLGTDLASSFGQALESARKFSDFLPAIGKSIQQFGIKSFVTEPLEKFLQGGIRSFIDSAGGGGNANGKDQKAAATASAAAEALTLAKNGEANAVAIATTSIGSLSTAANIAASNVAKLAASAAGGSGSDLLGAVFGSTGDYNSLGAEAHLADGTNYVPYDGFRAVLHKGESVTPAKYNPAAGGAGGGNTVINVQNNTDGRARAEETRQPNGDREIRVIVDRAVAEMESRVARGGSTYQVMKNTFNVQKVMARRG